MSTPALPLREIPSGPPIGMEEFLRLFPWSETQRNTGEPLEWLWHYDYQAPLERVWPFIVDTSRLQRQVVFTRALMERPNVVFWLSQQGLSPEMIDVALPELGGTVEAARLGVK